MNKKGIVRIAAGLVIIIGLIVTGIFFVNIDPLAKNIYTRVNSTSYLDSDAAHDIITHNYDNYSSFWDGAFLFLFGGLWIAGLLIGYYADNDKLVLLIMFFALVILLFAGAELTDYWLGLTDDNLKLAGENIYPTIYFLLDNLIWVILGIIASGFIVGFIKDY